MSKAVNGLAGWSRKLVRTLCSVLSGRALPPTTYGRAVHSVAWGHDRKEGPVAICTHPLMTSNLATVGVPALWHEPWVNACGTSPGITGFVASFCLLALGGIARKTLTRQFVYV